MFQIVEMFTSGQVRPASIMKINSKNIVIVSTSMIWINQEELNHELSRKKTLDVVI